MPRVLVIDDDEQFLNLMKTALSRNKFEVIVAHNGKQGIKMCENTPVDLVITDLIMPEMEGLEVIMELKQKVPNLKILAVSGGGRNDPASYLDLATALGAKCALTKPFSMETLLKTVKQLISGE
ncbi:MAG: response regulator transcription factor [Syntrophobacteraceae bacterium]|nr:response regulator transcription factor [Syntrophobacteraceae bacterium]